jgi:hypothetical protein
MDDSSVALLNDVFRLLVVAQDAARDPVEIAVVASDERAECVGVTVPRPFEQFAVAGVVHSIRHRDGPRCASPHPKDDRPFAARGL